MQWCDVFHVGKPCRNDVEKQRSELATAVNEACASVVCIHPLPISTTTRVSGTGERIESHTTPVRKFMLKV